MPLTASSIIVTVIFLDPDMACPPVG